jgi:hypothetical protein
MREIFTYGTVGRAPGNRCLYPEPDVKKYAVYRKILCKLGSHQARWLSANVLLAKMR